MSISNNPFAVHDWSYLSASQINTFVYSPALWLAQVAGYRSTVGPAAFRGTAVGVAMQAKAVHGHEYNTAMFKAEHAYLSELQKNGISAENDKAIKERQLVERTIEACFSSIDSGAIEEEKRIEVQIGDLPVPFIGYIDIAYEDYLVEMKSKAITTNKMDSNAARQASIYSLAENKPCQIYYLCPKGVTIFQPDYEKCIKEVEIIANAMMNTLALSSDPREIIRNYHYPNLDDWRFGVDERKFFESIY